MANSYWGAVLDKNAAARWDEGSLGALWQYSHPQVDLVLRASGTHWQTLSFDSCVLLIRGRAALASQAATGRSIQASTYIQQYYQEHRELPVDDLEGSFTLVLLDGRAGRVVLYRHIVGNGFTYYTQMPNGLFFGSNLAELVEVTEARPRPNTDALPAFFLFRSVPGRQTLFAGVHRLMPGEELVFDGNRLQRRQRRTFADFRSSDPVGRDAVDQVEATMSSILTDWAANEPATANLLSGGVDSSYLQAIWNRVRPAEDGLPLSFSVSVDHPRTRPDVEYARSAARALGTRHTLVPADGPYIDYLLETLAATGEPPNHVMSAYFGPLARAMTARGIGSGLCGEGADSLFGLPSADLLRTAQAFQRCLPIPAIRHGAARLAALAGRDFLHSSLLLADWADDATAVPHPINQAAVFTDWPAVSSCFGSDGVANALAYRRTLVDQYRIANDPLDRLHAIGYLGEAMDTASLWTTLFNTAGADLCCPYLDSRLLRLIVNLDPRHRYVYRRPKDLLKRALARHVPADLVQRSKLGFGQPIFEWLSPGGQLRPWVERIAAYPFVDRAALAIALARPNWFLYSLLCYDLWHKLFIDRSLSRHSYVATPRRADVTALTR